ncbi:MAG: hypothetical protein WBA77_19060 [Microcoleaceae cyanobacterium]
MLPFSKSLATTLRVTQLPSWSAYNPAFKPQTAALGAMGLAYASLQQYPQGIQFLEQS